MPKKILIAEDEKPMAKALEVKFNREGFEVTTVFNGEDALIALSKEKFDLAIIDLIMPRMDGWGILEGVKAKKIKTPIIVASNLGSSEDEKRAKDLGAVDYLIKADTQIAEIIERVKKFLNQ